MFVYIFSYLRQIKENKLFLNDKAGLKNKIKLENILDLNFLLIFAYGKL
jgi:hypothetical protein